MLLFHSCRRSVLLVAAVLIAFPFYRGVTFASNNDRNLQEEEQTEPNTNCRYWLFFWLCDHPRNLQEQIEPSAALERGGVDVVSSNPFISTKDCCQWSPQCPKGYTDFGELDPILGDRLCGKNGVDCGDVSDYDDDGSNGLFDCPTTFVDDHEGLIDYPMASSGGVVVSSAFAQHVVVMVGFVCILIWPSP